MARTVDIVWLVIFVGFIFLWNLWSHLIHEKLPNFNYITSDYSRYSYATKYKPTKPSKLPKPQKFDP